MSRIVKGYWYCKYCGTKDIDGLVDTCPNCGKQKSEDVKYYMAGTPVEVTDEELKKARIKREECDGNHKDWVCDYCNQLNNYSDKYCFACGAPKSEATKEYGGKKIQKRHESYESHEPQYNVPKYEDYYSSDEQNDYDTKSTKSESNTSDENYANRNTKRNSFPIKDILPSILKIGGISSLVLLFTVLMVWLFAPIEKEVTVNGFSWDRQITVEEERTVKESGWSVPNGGRVYDERLEISGYVSVIDHYEDVSEVKTKQVIDHYETTYTYTDNGNGTFTEVPHQNPVYRTETYTETHQEPVYRQEPVYDTKYYYEIEKWFNGQNYASEGYDKEPYWNESYTLKSNERDTKRSEHYYIHYNDGDKDSVSYSEWMEIDEGDGFILKQNRLGITYSKEIID